MKFLDSVGDDLSYFQTFLPDCLCPISFRRYSQLSVEVVEKRNKCKRCLASNFFPVGDDPNCSTADC